MDSSKQHYRDFIDQLARALLESEKVKIVKDRSFTIRPNLPPLKNANKKKWT